tara:strand:+ start:13226 stop:14539 length:1314 start_codon:yes stop_codon:yes gene_type:complete
MKNSLNLDNYWMPFTANQLFKENPRLLVESSGMYYTSHDDRNILDGVAGLWCCNVGHCHPTVVSAIREQVGKLDYSTIFNMAHPKIFELAEKVSSLTPEGLDRIFFGNSGSEAVETAMKVVLGYHALRGEPNRTKFIGREKGYHGVNFGGTSVGGIPLNKDLFGSLFSDVDLIPHTWNPAYMAFSKGVPSWGGHLADILEEKLLLHDPSTVAAVIIEPVTGSGGVIVPPEGYLKKIRDICDKYNILLIFDEVITGFGRLGHSFAAERFQVRPDIITMAKGLTSGVIPMSAVAFRNDIHQEFMSASPDSIELFHGYTYSGHPVASAAALAVLEVYEEEDLFNRALSLETLFEDTLHSLKGINDSVLDIRNIGLMGAIHFNDNKGPANATSMKVFQECYDQGLLLRSSADYLVISPALIVQEEQILKIGETLKSVINKL